MEILEQLGINTGFFWMLGLYLGSFIIIYFLGLKDVCDAVVERSNRIVGRAEKVVQLKLHLQKIQDELAQHVKQARIDANEVFLNLRTKASKEQKKILTEAREKSAGEIKEARATIQTQAGAELKKLENEIPQFARLILDQIMTGGAAASKSKPSELRG